MCSQSSRRLSIVTIALFLGAVGVLMWLYAKDVVLMNDELYYQAVWHRFFGDNHEMIHSLGDVARSQWNHYFTWSGRALVHTVEQIFSGVLPYKWFYPINTLVLIVFWALIVAIGAKRLVTRSLWPYLIAVVGSVYVLAEAPNLLTGLNLGVNYLWSGTAMLVAIVLWRRWQGCRFAWWKSALIVLLGVALGWTHEGFCAPLSLAFGVYYLARRKPIRLDGALWLVAGYWLGTLLLVVAPGNYLRGATEGNVFNLSSMLVFLLYIKDFWALVASLALLSIFRLRWVKRWWQGSRFLLILLAIQIVVLLLIHALPRSMMPIDLISIVLLIRLWMPALESGWGRSWWSNALSLIGGIVILLHLCGLVKTQRVMNQSIQAMVDDYVNHDDCIAVLGDVPSNPLYNRWLRRIIHPISLHWYYCPEKEEVIVVSKAELWGLEHPRETLVEQNRLFQGVPIYGWEYCEHLWIPGDSVPPGARYRMILGDQCTVEGLGASLSKRMQGRAACDTILLPADSLHVAETRFGRWGYLNIPSRKIIAIEPVND